LIFISICTLIMGLAIAWLIIPKGDPETEIREKAAAAFEHEDYREAHKLYVQAADAFLDSERHKEYEFYRDLSHVLKDATSAVIFADPIMEDLQRFLRNNQDHPLLQKNTDKVWKVFDLAITKVLKDAEETALTSDNLDKIDAARNKAASWLQEAKPYWPDPKEAPRSILEKIAKLEQKVKDERYVLQFLKKIDKPSPTLEDVDFYREAAKQLRLEKDPRVQKKLDELLKKALPSVKYQAMNLPGTQPPPEPIVPGALIGPRVGDAGVLPAGQGVVFAVARGVLYTLAENDGHILWATRIGIDTARLPVRVPATQVDPEIVLVLSSDTNTLTARRVLDGAALWQHQLPAPCLARPVIVERDIRDSQGGVSHSRRAYVPTVDGRVQEIEIAGGGLIGEYLCGLPLLVGGAREPNSNLLYFPADRGYVFVLDVALGQCVGVLRTGQPSGSLRGEPILAGDGSPQRPGQADTGPRFLILCQTAGLDKMKLRAWQLPVDFRTFDDKPSREIDMRGWSWFEPYADGEKIALATDAGVLGLFGIQQKNNADSAIFPLISEQMKEIPLGGRGALSGRAQVVHGTENDFWVLAKGDMQQWRLGWNNKKGLTVGSSWPQALALGSPLHAGQVNAASDTVFVVTQSPTRQTCLATAVDALTGNIRWQRQLGMVCAGDPLALGNLVLAVDSSGGLFLFNSAQPPHRPGFEWQFVQEQRLASPPATPTEGVSHLLTGNGGTAYVISSQGKDNLLVRRIAPGKKPGEQTVEELSFKITLAGTPALAGDHLVLPLADGNLARLNLSKGGRPDASGPNWRAEDADAGAPGHVVHLGGNVFLYTDGSNRLKRFSWPAGQDWAVPKEELNPPPFERIVAAPLVIPSGDGKSPPRILVADASGTLTLLAGEQLQKSRAWKVDGEITSGPFLRGNHVGCVVNHRRLVWINPDKDGFLWTYGDAGSEAIVGQPQRLGDRLIVAHRDGRLVSLDVAKGQPRGKGFATRASVAPAAAPAAFDADRIFVPLTDGTVLLLPVADVEKPGP
jgi:outer membrane protein assembly factor BamB